MTEKLHKCSGSTRWSSYGEAITECFELDTGYLVAGNGEYGSEVNFCPYCGYQAKKPAVKVIECVYVKTI